MNELIVLAHTNPENYTMPTSQNDPKAQCSMWFIGLEFKKMEKLNVYLTHDIQQFFENVEQHAINIQMYKETMRLEARYIKRKQVSELRGSQTVLHWFLVGLQLSQYLPPEVIERERNSNISATKNGVLQFEVKKRTMTEDKMSGKKPRRCNEDQSARVSRME